MLFIVQPGKKAIRIFFRDTPPNSNYTLTAGNDWNAKVTIANKKLTSFVIRFSLPAPDEGGVASIDVPGHQIYTAAQMVYEEQLRNRRAWNSLQRTAERVAADEVQRIQRQREEEIREVQRRPEIVIVRRGDRTYHCNHCGQEGEGIQWARMHHHQTSQTTLSIEQPKRERVKKKKPASEARLTALVNASIGG